MQFLLARWQYMNSVPENRDPTVWVVNFWLGTPFLWISGRITKLYSRTMSYEQFEQRLKLFVRAFLPITLLKDLKVWLNTHIQTEYYSTRFSRTKSVEQYRYISRTAFPVTESYTLVQILTTYLWEVLFFIMLADTPVWPTI